MDADGTVHAYPLGGGFHYIFDPIKVETYDFIKVPAKLLHNPNWRATDFYAEWLEKKYRGWTTGQRWNGWAMPFFEFEEATKYAKDSGNTVYDPARDAFVTKREDLDEEEVDEATVILVKGRGALKVYPIGAGSWIWSEAQEDEDEEQPPIVGPSLGSASLGAFTSSKLHMTEGAREAFETTGDNPEKFLDRHFSEDFGESPPEDLEINRQGARTGGMVMSIYSLSNGERIYIITDDGHEVTTILLPEEY